MSRRTRRRRALLLLSLALASGGLAASLVRERVRGVESQVGPPVPVVVAARDLPADRELRAGDLAVREVPESFVPRDSLGSPGEARGLRTAVPLPSGSYLTAGSVQGAAGAGGAGSGRTLRRGERALELGVSGGEALSGSAGPGGRVDVLVSTEARDGAGRTFVALEDVELLGLRAGGDPSPVEEGGDSAGGAAEAATATATLRVTLRQAIYLTAAENFAREIRLLPRPPGDRGRSGRAAVSAAGL